MTMTMKKTMRTTMAMATAMAMAMETTMTVRKMDGSDYMQMIRACGLLK
jgi:hypothetical protein